MEITRKFLEKNMLGYLLLSNEEDITCISTETLLALNLKLDKTMSSLYSKSLNLDLSNLLKNKEVIEDGDLSLSEIEIALKEFMKNKPYVCPILKLVDDKYDYVFRKMVSICGNKRFYLEKENLDYIEKNILSFDLLNSDSFMDNKKIKLIDDIQYITESDIQIVNILETYYLDENRKYFVYHDKDKIRKVFSVNDKTIEKETDLTLSFEILDSMEQIIEFMCDKYQNDPELLEYYHNKECDSIHFLKRILTNVCD